MPISDIDAGRLLEKMDAVHSDIGKIWTQVDSLGKFEAVTEERLKRGAESFAKMDTRIEKVEARRCPKPGYVWIIGAIGIGFTIIGFLSKVG
jgi:hypothetical protein